MSEIKYTGKKNLFFEVMVLRIEKKREPYETLITLAHLTLCYKFLGIFVHCSQIVIRDIEAMNRGWITRTFEGKPF